MIASLSAIKALVFNRVGDLGLALGIATMFNLYGSLDYATVGLLTPLVCDDYVTLIMYQYTVCDLVSLSLYST